MPARHADGSGGQDPPDGDRTAPILSRRALLAALAAAPLSLMASGCRTTSHSPDLELFQLPGRFSVTGDQFSILSDFRLEQEHPLVQDLNQLRQDVLKTLSLEPSTREVVVYLFDSEQLYAGYMRTTWPGLPYRRAYFFGNSYELDVYTYWGDRIREDLRHEFTHGILYGSVRRLPLWLDEGLAEYFEVAGPQPGTVKPETSRRLVEAVANGWRPDLERLEQLDNVADMGQGDYEEAWAWVHFLLHSDPGLKPVLLSYLHDLQTGSGGGSLSRRLHQTGLKDWSRLTAYITSLNSFGMARV